eukprot:Hpha_TRINITY_DN19757_c0_g1::TRINITY_DN19757_c0_g1_i1::g.21805::m.21805
MPSIKDMLKEWEGIHQEFAAADSAVIRPRAPPPQPRPTLLARPAAPVVMSQSAALLKRPAAPPIEMPNTDGVDRSTDAKRRRLERFAAKSREAPPPLPKRDFAHPGGKVTTNEPAATVLFLAKRKASGERLTPEQQRALFQLPPDRAAVVDRLARSMCSA